MKRECTVFVCVLVCLLATPVAVNMLARKLGRTLDEEHRARAVLYLCTDAVLIVIIFGFWLLG